MIINELFAQPKLRVLFLTPGLRPGGAEQHLLTLMRHSQRVKYVGVIAKKAEPSIEVPCPVHWVHSEEGVAAAVKEIPQNYDLIVYWGLKPMDLAWVGVPVIHLVHYSAKEDTNDGHKQYVKEYGKTNANFLCCVSKSGIEAFPEDKRKLSPPTVIYNGADMERTRPLMGREWQRKQWGVSDNQKLVLYVGRFYPGKGADVLIDALEYLPMDYHAVLVGWGEQQPDLIKRAKETGRVIFPQPRLSGLGDYYAAADVVALPSASEAFPLVMVEAWHAHRPLVCSSFATLLDIEREYAGGRPMAVPVSRPPSPVGVAEGIRHAYRFAVEDDGRVQRAYEIAAEHFTASAMAGRFETYLYGCDATWKNTARNGAMYRP